jgi:uncharacterized protein
MNKTNKRQPNRLINEKSPYLLQHAYNPVDWYPWGNEAFNRAKAENKPVFLSIGYSTCHWCHVMENDSFEDEKVASLLNSHFIPIKVDREERPDLDQQYMAACQALTGQGGWPLTVFLTPDQKPFYAGTFFPRENRFGINGLLEILPRISAYWQKEQDRVIEVADQLVSALKNNVDNSHLAPALLSKQEVKTVLENAYQGLKNTYDHDYGGFGSAPKFPASHQLLFLMQYAYRYDRENARIMVQQILKALYRGGIFDQIGYGLHRYSVDRQWLVPHFEKMLYDQAITALAAAESYKVDGNQEAADLAKKIISYVLENLQGPEGAFYTAEDADSEGVEGTYYVWALAELINLLGPKHGKIAADYYGLTEEGNFEDGYNVLSRPVDDQRFAADKGIDSAELDKILVEVREKMLAWRSKRVKPFRDDKIITAWNGLMIAALARAGVSLKQPQYIMEAERALNFIENNLVSSSGRLLRRYRENEAAVPAFLDDYAALVWALIELFKASGKQSYLEAALAFNGKALILFVTEDGRVRYRGGVEEEGPLELEAEAYDGAFPSGFSMLAMNQILLGRLTQDNQFIERAEKLIASRFQIFKKQPTAYTYLLTALDSLFNPVDYLPHCSADGSCKME